MVNKAPWKRQTPLKAILVKMKIKPRALENRNILLHAFPNSSEYTRCVQFTKLMIQAAVEAMYAALINSMKIQYFTEEENLYDMHVEPSYHISVSTGSLEQLS